MAVTQSQAGQDHAMTDVESDLDDIIEEVLDSKSKPDTSTPPPSSRVTYIAPVPTEAYPANCFNTGLLSGWILFKAKKANIHDKIIKRYRKWELGERQKRKFSGDNRLVLMS